MQTASDPLNATNQSLISSIQHRVLPPDIERAVADVRSEETRLAPPYRVSLVYTLWFFEWSASRPSSVTLKSLARLPAGTITSQGTRSRLFNRKALRLDKSPHHGILCNYTLSWSISMVHGNRSPLVIPERISVHSSFHFQGAASGFISFSSSSKMFQVLFSFKISFEKFNFPPHIL